MNGTKRMNFQEVAKNPSTDLGSGISHKRQTGCCYFMRASRGSIRTPLPPPPCTEQARIQCSSEHAVAGQEPVFHTLWRGAAAAHLASASGSVRATACALLSSHFAPASGPGRLTVRIQRGTTEYVNRMCLCPSAGPQAVAARTH